MQEYQPSEFKQIPLGQTSVRHSSMSVAKRECSGTFIKMHDQAELLDPPQPEPCALDLHATSICGRSSW